ncbi:MAG: RuBisCO large subunit C-terminal-like domain-containing protein [Methanomassiliicoccaceae archaeon]|nr:RuBisCO large subunit C-terminal-like domain-containing protein [Methanomassiliicoccaceae archaeon]
MKTYSYLHLGEKIDLDAHVVCKYRVTSDLPIEEAANAVAAEQSTGTWTGITTLHDEEFRRCSGKVIDITGNLITVAFPEIDFDIEVGGIPQIFSIISGNLFGLEALHKVRLEDVDFPPGILKKFKGPKFGAEGIRKLVDRPEKPLVGTIVKPKIGLSAKDTAKYVYEGGTGGLTNSKDDETLVDQSFCPLETRTKLIAEKLDILKEEGHKMIHSINISTGGHKIVDLARDAQSWGATILMIDVITTGFEAVKAVAEDPKIKIPIHIHRTMHGAMTRDPLHGISMLPLTKLIRMCGGDATHVGTFGVGKMAGTVEGDRDLLNASLSKVGKYKTMMPICSGGVYPGMIGTMIKASGMNVQVQAGGGVAGHPGGVKMGAMGMVQAVDAAFEGIDVVTYAKTHPELQTALDLWGVR